MRSQEGAHWTIGRAGSLLALLALVVAAPAATAVADKPVPGGQAHYRQSYALHSTRGALGMRVSTLPVLATFAPKTQFPEGLAIDRSGSLYVSVTTWGKTEKDPNTGRVWRITPAGKKTAFGPNLQLGGGLLTGVAVDARNRVYVAHATYDNATPPGVWRIGRGAASRLVNLRVGGFPNGLAFHGGALYVSDSALGAIWRVKSAGSASLWKRDSLLAPGKRGLGANGIVFSRNHLYVTVTDAGRIVGIPVATSGSAGKPVTVVRSKKLVGADGITVDTRGTLYVVSDLSNLLLRLPVGGTLEQLATRTSGLLYPTSLAFGRLGTDENLLHIVNGDYFGKETPNLVSFDVAALPES